MRVFFLTGEPSGDLHGARLAQALVAREPHTELLGVGGARMRQAGCWVVAFGVESGSQQILDKMKKGQQVARARQIQRQRFGHNSKQGNRLLRKLLVQ